MDLSASKILMMLKQLLREPQKKAYLLMLKNTSQRKEGISEKSSITFM